MPFMRPPQRSGPSGGRHRPSERRAGETLHISVTCRMHCEPTEPMYLSEDVGHRRSATVNCPAASHSLSARTASIRSSRAFRKSSTNLAEIDHGDVGNRNHCLKKRSCRGSGSDRIHDRFLFAEGTRRLLSGTAPLKAPQIPRYLTPSDPPAERVRALVGTCPATLTQNT